jgi:hypothetical protein
MRRVAGWQTALLSLPLAQLSNPVTRRDLSQRDARHFWDGYLARLQYCRCRSADLPAVLDRQASSPSHDGGAGTRAS